MISCTKRCLSVSHNRIGIDRADIKLMNQLDEVHKLSLKAKHKARFTSVSVAHSDEYILNFGISASKSLLTQFVKA